MLRCCEAKLPAGARPVERHAPPARLMYSYPRARAMDATLSHEVVIMKVLELFKTLHEVVAIDKKLGQSLGIPAER